MASPDLPETALPRRRSRRRRIVTWVVGIVVLLLVAAIVGAAILAKEALAARGALTDAIDRVPAVETALRAGDTDAATAALDDVQPLTEKARTNTDGPLWALAAHVPGIGADAHAVTTASAALDTITQDVLPPLVGVADVVSGDALAPEDGGLDLAPLAAAAPDVVAASAAMDGVTAELATIDTSAVLPVLADPLDTLKERSDDLASTAQTGANLAQLVPPMLGADGPRRYLLMSLNNAELRAAGGIPGAVAAIDVDGGKITLGPQASTDDLGTYAKPVKKLSPDDAALFTTRLGRFPQDTVLTPDFPTAASLLATMWSRSQGGTADGVIATDPVALSYLLAATGPVEVGPVEVTSDNAVKLLLSDAYAELEAGPTTDRFFAAVAAQVFAALASGDADVAVARDALDRAASEHRFQVWSAAPDEAELMQDTVVSGAIDTAPRAASSLGVFFDDGVSGKMSYYLDSKVKVVASRCEYLTRVDTVQVTLTSTAPKDAATSLPEYVTGNGSPPGTMITNVTFYSAQKGTVSTVLRGELPLTGGEYTTHDGRGVAVVTQSLRPGESATLTAEVTSLGAGPELGDADARRASRTGELDVWSTPTATVPGLQTVDVPSCT